MFLYSIEFAARILTERHKIGLGGMGTLIEIFTDGACSNNQDKENSGGYGAVLLYEGIEKRISAGEKNTSNNRMELMAVIEALKKLKRKDISIRLYSDSAYIVNCINEKWYVNWRKNGWKTSAKEPVLNKELWGELLTLYESFKEIRIIKIKGHINYNNESSLKAAYSKLKPEEKVGLGLSEYKRLLSYNAIADKLATEAANSLE